MHVYIYSRCLYLSLSPSLLAASAVVLAEARPAATLAFASSAVVLADAPPAANLALAYFLLRLCPQILDLPQLLHCLLVWLFSQMPPPKQLLQELLCGCARRALGKSLRTGSTEYEKH